MPFLQETGVWTQEPVIHSSGKGSADTDADENKAVMWDRKVACADEYQRDCLEHWKQSEASGHLAFDRKGSAHILAYMMPYASETYIVVSSKIGSTSNILNGRKMVRWRIALRVQSTRSLSA